MNGLNGWVERNSFTWRIATFWHPYFIFIESLSFPLDLHNFAQQSIGIFVLFCFCTIVVVSHFFVVIAVVVCLAFQCSTLNVHVPWHTSNLKCCFLLILCHTHMNHKLTHFSILSAFINNQFGSRAGINPIQFNPMSNCRLNRIISKYSIWPALFESLDFTIAVINHNCCHQVLWKHGNIGTLHPFEHLHTTTTKTISMESKHQFKCNRQL